MIARLLYRLGLRAHPLSRRELDAYWMGAFTRVRDERLEEVDALLVEVWENGIAPGEKADRKHTVPRGESACLHSCDYCMSSVAHVEGQWHFFDGCRKDSFAPVTGERQRVGCALLRGTPTRTPQSVHETRTLASDADRPFATSAFVRTDDLARSLIGHLRLGPENAPPDPTVRRALVRALEKRARKLERRGLLRAAGRHPDCEDAEAVRECWGLTDRGFDEVLDAIREGGGR